MAKVISAVANEAAAETKRWFLLNILELCKMQMVMM